MKKQSVKFVLRYKQDIFDTIFGNTIMIASQGEEHASFSSMSGMLFYLRKPQFVCASHGNNLHSYVEKKDLECFEVTEITYTQSIKIDVGDKE